MMLGPKQETREVFGQMVRTVWWTQPRYRCDRCQKVIDVRERVSGGYVPGDYCSELCALAVGVVE
jgi:hypothetical protein